MSNIDYQTTWHARLRRLRREDAAQALVGGTIALCLLSLVLLVVAIVAFMVTKRTDVIVAARHAAWLDAMHYDAADAGAIGAHVDELFFDDPTLFSVNPPEFEEVEGAGDSGLSQIVTYHTRYGHDPFDDNLDPDSLPGILALWQVRLPLIGQEEPVMGDSLDEGALGRTLAFVDASCSWDRVGNTWPCPGDMFEGLYDLAGDIIGELSPF